MSKPPSKSIHEDFANFFENPTRESFRKFIKSHIGETDNCDFKSEWPAWHKLAKHALAIANTGGGCLIVGIDQNNPIGLIKLIDKADIFKGIQKFVPSQLEYTILDFHYESSEYPKLVGKNFQVFLISDTPQYIPFLARADGDGIRRNTIYTRNGTNSEEASYEALQQMFNRRLETGYSSQREMTLEMHLAELKMLYDSIPRRRDLIDFNYVLEVSETVANRDYPNESYWEFVARLIETKKKIIEQYMHR